VFTADGSGTLAAVNRLRFSGRELPGSPLASDLNGDGLADLVVTSGYNPWQFFVLLGVGDGTWRSVGLYPALNGFGILRTGDFNGDTFRDLLVREHASSVAIFFGDGKGRFAGPHPFGVGYITDGLEVVDADADGIEDLIRIVSHGAGAELSGAKCPRPEPEYVLSYPQETRHQGGSPVVADLDRNGIPDLVLGERGFTTSTASILIGVGNGEFQPARLLGAPRGVRGVAVADLNGDNRLDVVTADEVAGTLSLFHGDGGGGFEAAGQVPVSQRPISVAAIDVNRDSRPDLLSLDVDTKELSVALARQDAYEVTVRLPADPSLFGPQDVRHLIASGDFDRNGTIDLAVPSVAGGIAIYLGDGDGGFAPGPAIPVALGQAYSIQVLDLNEDGILDLASTHAGASSISVLLGRGDGTFELSGRFAVGPDALGFAAADVNADGHTDLLVGSYFSGNQMSLITGRGDGTFDPAVLFPWTYATAATTAADFDGDGLVDVVSSNGAGLSIGNGMRLSCARPREPETVVPYGACMLIPEAGGQELSCF
jgi:hypothetical protein